MDGQTHGTEPFDELNVINKRRAYGLLQRHDEQQKALEPVFRSYGPREQVIDIYVIGSYHIVEYIDKHLEPVKRFGVWVEGRDTHYAAESMDEAILVALCAKYDDPQRAPEYIARMIGMDKQKND